MKTYEEALAWVQELVDEKHSNELMLRNLNDLFFNAEPDSAEEKKLEKEIGYLRWRNQDLKGSIRGALSTLCFVYEEDGHDIYNDIELRSWEYSND